MISNFVCHEESWTLPTLTEQSSQDGGMRNIGIKNEEIRPDRLLESMETLSVKMNFKLSQEMDSLMNVMQT